MSINPTTRFTDRVDNYVRARPTYPTTVVDALRDKLGLAPGWTIADVGSGTGISSRLLLNAGCKVIGIEPNDAMRAAAEREFADDRRFSSVNATAESTTLPEASVDLVVAAQAFHWFDRVAFGRECQRILRPGRSVCLMWNDRLTTGSGFSVRFEAMLMRFSEDYARVNHRAQVTKDEAKLRAFFTTKSYQVVHLHNAQTLDWPGLQARLLSSSYAPKQGQPNHEPMMADLRSLFDETNRDGAVTIEYDLQLHIGLPA